MKILVLKYQNKRINLLCFALFCAMSFKGYSANTIYNITSYNTFTGGASYCQDQTASNLSVTWNNCSSGPGGSLATTVTITWYSNTSNSTSGGTQVSQTTGASTGTSATVVYTYTPVTTSAGTLYYYAVVSAPSNTICGFTTTLTTSVTQTVTVTECFKTSVAGASNYNTAASWVENAIPQSYDRVIISDGSTVTINAAAAAYSITLGGGTSGILIFEPTTARTLTVTTNVTITSGGTFQSAASGTQTGHILSIGGNLTNNGTLDFSTNSNTASAGITFTGSSDATFSGTGGTTDIKTLTINKGTSSTPVLELSTSNFSIQGVTTDVAGFLTLTNGTFKISGSFTMTNRIFTTAGYTIAATTGIYLNNSNFTVAAQTASQVIHYGNLTINAGTYNSGVAADNDFSYLAGSQVNILGGAFNIAGRFTPAGASPSTTYTQSGGIVTLCTVGLTAAGPSFWLNAASTFTMSGGYIVLRLANTGASKYDYDNSASTRTITGGTVQLGDGSSGTAKTYIITGYFPNLLITSTSGNHIAKTFNSTINVVLTTTLQTNTTLDASTNSSAVTYTGDVTIGTSATFLGGSNTQTVSANWINNGTFTSSTGTVTFNGTSAITGSSTNSFYNLTLTGSLTAPSGGNINVSNSYVNTSGTFVHNNGTVTFNGSANQVITTGGVGATKQFYNVTVDNTAGTPADATDVDADAMYVGNTLTVNDGQFQPATTSDFADITINTNGIFKSDASASITVSGNWANSGTFTHNSSTVTFDGGAAQTISGSATSTFNNLTIANTSGDVALSVNAIVNSTLTMTTGDLVIATAKTLTINDVVDPGISGGSTTSMVVTSGTASMIKNYSSTTAVSFPLGNGTIYKPLTITPSAATASNWTVSYTHSPYSGLTVTGGLNRVSHLEYWTVNQSVNLNSTVQIPWISDDGVTSYTLLQVAKYNGADWAGIASTPSGTNSSGNLPTTAATTIGTSTSYFTIGSTSSVNVLPIELVSFTGKTNGKNNELNWETATEINNDFFTIEKTNDGTTFEIVGIQNGAGNSTSYLNYSLMDYDVRNSINYYRLKQTDFDGKFTLSELISIDNRTNKIEKEIVMTTNILGQEVNQNYRGLVVIIYSDGTSIKVIQ